MKTISGTGRGTGIHTSRPTALRPLFRVTDPSPRTNYGDLTAPALFNGAGPPVWTAAPSFAALPEDVLHEPPSARRSPAGPVADLGGRRRAAEADQAPLPRRQRPSPAGRALPPAAAGPGEAR